MRHTGQLIGLRVGAISGVFPQGCNRRKGWLGELLSDKDNGNIYTDVVPALILFKQVLVLCSCIEQTAQ